VYLFDKGAVKKYVTLGGGVGMITDFLLAKNFCLAAKLGFERKMSHVGRKRAKKRVTYYLNDP
jgi:hypothetical protein